MNILKRFCLLRFLLVSALLVSLLVSFASCKKDEVQEEAPPVPKDVIVVLDTSLSMIGRGGRNIMPQVKESLSRFVDIIRVGDSFTFFTFDSEVQEYPTINIRDENDIDIVKNYVGIVEAKGQWTFTMKMLQAVLKKADEIEKRNEAALIAPDEDKKDEDVSASERQIVLIILTDALDDPPPVEKNKQLNIESIASKYSSQDWFVYFINLGELENNAKVQSLREGFQKNITENTEIIDASGDVQEPIEEKLEQSIKKNERIAVRKPIYQSAWFYIVLFLLLLGVFAVFYLIHNSKIKLFGTIEYKNKIVLGAQFQSINLERYEARRIAVGKDSLCQVRLSDFDSHKSLVFEAAFIDNELHVFVNTDQGINIKVLAGKGEPYLSDGVHFEAGGYEFVYRAVKNS